MTIENFWREFLAATGRPSDTPIPKAFYFELTEYWANALLALVLAGQKRATASSLYSFQIEKERLPQAGDLYIVTDFAGEPRCVIETTAVTMLPFSEITFEICKREGEDDCLESWQAGHRKFFLEEGRQLGYTFTEEMPVVFEDFRVVYQQGKEIS